MKGILMGKASGKGRGQVKTQVEQNRWGLGQAECLRKRVGTHLPSSAGSGKARQHDRRKKHRVVFGGVQTHSRELLRHGWEQWLSGFSVLVKKGMWGKDRGRRDWRTKEHVQGTEGLLPRILVGGQEMGENIVEEY